MFWGVFKKLILQFVDNLNSSGLKSERYIAQFRNLSKYIKNIIL